MKKTKQRHSDGTVFQARRTVVEVGKAIFNSPTFIELKSVGGMIIPKTPMGTVLFIYLPIINVISILASYIVFKHYFIECQSMPHGLSANWSPVLAQIIGGNLHTALPLGATFGPRLTWICLTNLLVLAYLGGVVVGSILIFNTLKEFRGRYSLLRKVLLCGSSIVGPGAIIATVLRNFKISDITFDLYKNTISTEISNFNDVSIAVFGLTLHIAIFLAITGGVFLASILSTRTNATVGFYILKIDEIHLLLYISAIILVLSITQLNAALDWVLAYYPDKTSSSQKIIQNVCSIIVNMRAAYFSLILGGIYLPGAFLLRRKIQELAAATLGKESTQTNQKEWMQEQGLVLSYPTQVSKILALLGPVLTGMAAQALKAFGG